MRARSVWSIVLVIVLVVLAGAALLTWDEVYRDRPQPTRITSDPDANFLYGSIGNEGDSGLPYWVAVVLPRVFGERYLPGPGGYAALLPWEEGQELPVGFAKKRVGVDRVGFNCALCHTADRRLNNHDTPRIADAGKLRRADIQGLAEFFSRSASDARFSADTILTEVDLAYRLSVVDRALYRYVLIPRARQRLIALGRQLTSPHAAVAGGTAPFPKSIAR
jgi:hypothetical protein